MVRLRGRIGVECKASRAGQVGLRVAETAAKRPGRTADGPGLFDKLFAFTFIIVTSKGDPAQLTDVIPSSGPTGKCG